MLSYDIFVIFGNSNMHKWPLLVIHACLNFQKLQKCHRTMSSILFHIWPTQVSLERQILKMQINCILYKYILTCPFGSCMFNSNTSTANHFSLITGVLKRQVFSPTAKPNFNPNNIGAGQFNPNAKTYVSGSFTAGSSEGGSFNPGAMPSGNFSSSQVGASSGGSSSYNPNSFSAGNFDPNTLSAANGNYDPNSQPVGNFDPSVFG